MKQISGLLKLDLFPLRKVARGYNVSKCSGDMRAGLNVALLAFPQGMAYAAIAGLPIQYGIYGSAIAAIFGTLLAGSRFIALGPTNATSVLLFASFLGLGVTGPEKELMIPLVIIMAGCFLVAGAFLGVATLIQFISRSVATGYITAAAVYIIVNQIRKVAGVEFEIAQETTFFDVIQLTLSHLPDAHLPTVFLAAVTALVYWSLQKKCPKWPNVAICLVLVSFFTYAMDAIMSQYPQWTQQMGGHVQKLSAIDASKWPVGVPAFNYDWIHDLAPVALVIAFLSILEGTSIGKTLAARSGSRIDPNQEMLSMGVSNIGCAFFGGMPASGSLTRSQLNWTSGAATQLSGLFTGIICLLGAFVLGPFTQYIPVATLGVLVIAIGMSLVNKHNIMIALKSTRSDAVVFIVTFVAALLLRLDLAIIIGALLSLILFLRKAAAPELVEYSFTDDGQLAQLQGAAKRPDPEVSIVHVEGDLFFASSEMFLEQLRRIASDPNLKILILKMRNARNIDATSILALEELLSSMNKNDRYLILSEVRPEVRKVIDNSGLIRLIGAENIQMDVSENPTMSTALAVRRAQEILGDAQGRVSIYAKPKADPNA